MIYEDRESNEIETKAKKTLGRTFSAKDIDVTILKTISYQYPQNKIDVEFTTDEFTCLCPFSGLPDFAVLTVCYVPSRRLIELKSLKYYLYSFRNVKIYNEHVVNKILGDLKKVLKPQKITIEAQFTNRGGIKNKVIVSYSSHKK